MLHESIDLLGSAVEEIKTAILHMQTMKKTLTLDYEDDLRLEKAINKSLRALDKIVDVIGEEYR